MTWARARIDEGRQRAGRTDRHAVVALCLLSISDADPAAARREMAAWAAPRLAAMATSGAPVTDADRELAALVGSVGVDALAAELPDALLDEYVAAGDRVSCRRRIDRLLDAGADRVVLVPDPAGMRSVMAMREQIHASTVLAAMD